MNLPRLSVSECSAVAALWRFGLAIVGLLVAVAVVAAVEYFRRRD